MPQKLTASDVEKYVKANPDSALASNILPLLAMGSNQLLFGAGNRIASNITAIPALFSKEKDYSKEVQSGRDFLNALAEYQKQKTPVAAPVSEGVGTLAGAGLSMLAAPATFGLNIPRTAPIFSRAAAAAKGASLDQAIRSTLGENGVYEKAVAEKNAPDAVKAAYYAIPKALQETVVAGLTAPIAQEVVRPFGKAVQYGASKTGLDRLSKYLSTDTKALERAGLSKEELGAARLVTGTSNIPGADRENQKTLANILRRDAGKASENIRKAKDLGIKISSTEAYSPYSNMVRDLEQKALGSSPEYSRIIGEMRINRPQQIGEKAAELRPQLLAAKDVMYNKVIGEETIPNAASTFSPITGEKIYRTKPLTVGELNQAKQDAYNLSQKTFGQEAIGMKTEADRLKQLLRSTPQGRKAEELYGLAEDMQPLKRLGGVSRYEQTSPYEGKFSASDIEKLLSKGRNLKDIAELTRGKATRPEVRISSQENFGADPALFLRTPNPTIRGNLNIIDFLDRRLANTPQKYFDKLAPNLAGSNLPQVAQKAGQFEEVLRAPSLSAPVARALTIGAALPASGASEDYNIPQYMPINEITSEELLAGRKNQAISPSSMDFTPEELQLLMRGARK